MHTSSTGISGDTSSTGISGDTSSIGGVYALVLEVCTH